MLHNRIRQQAIIITDATSPVSTSDRARLQRISLSAEIAQEARNRLGKQNVALQSILPPEVRYLVMAASMMSNGVGK
jgi:hypothetical protein